eukprot:1157787-Pelagomonas_calceolata.AAC.8
MAEALSATEQGSHHLGLKKLSAGALHAHPLLIGAQQEAALHNQPPYVTDENGMLTYQYDPEYIARNYEVFDLRVYHRWVSSDARTSLSQIIACCISWPQTFLVLGRCASAKLTLDPCVSGSWLVKAARSILT